MKIPGDVKMKPQANRHIEMVRYAIANAPYPNLVPKLGAWEPAKIKPHCNRAPVERHVRRLFHN